MPPRSAVPVVRRAHARAALRVREAASAAIGLHHGGQLAFDVAVSLVVRAVAMAVMAGVAVPVAVMAVPVAAVRVMAVMAGCAGWMCWQWRMDAMGGCAGCDGWM